jgi:hypothetical protein
MFLSRNRSLNIHSKRRAVCIHWVYRLEWYGLFPGVNECRRCFDPDLQARLCRFRERSPIVPSVERKSTELPHCATARDRDTTRPFSRHEQFCTVVASSSAIAFRHVLSHLREKSPCCPAGSSQSFLGEQRINERHKFRS